MPYSDKRKQRIYTTWKNMIRRCYNKDHTSYKYYGGKGITVCAEWQEFEPFYEWAIGSGYSDNLTIDRIDNNDNYKPQNCRWVTPKEQANNRSTNRCITFNGEAKTVAEWADGLGISFQSLDARLRSGNWSVEEALTTPAKTRPVKQPLFMKKIKQFSADGTLIKIWDSISEAAKTLNLPNSNISRALKNPQYTSGGYYWEYGS
jgi:hypothetical protein